LPRLDDAPGQLARGTGLEADVEEPRAGDLGRGDAGGTREPAGELLGERARVGPRPLRELHRDVGGPVPVLTLTRSLDLDLADVLGGQRERPVGDGVEQEGPD